MSSPVRRLSKSGSAGGTLVQLVNKGETSPVLLINPVFTINANNWAAACDAAATRRCYPKVRQKSKSSGASPQRNPSSGHLGFGEDFINIVTSTESVDVEFGGESIYEDYGSHPSSHSHSRPSSFHSNPYLNTSGGYESRYYYYGSNSKLLQVPSTSTLLLPQAEQGRQVRSSSITVPCSHTYSYSHLHTPRTPARCSSEVFIRRRCSSTSPNKAGTGSNNQPYPTPQRLSSSTHTSPRGRGFSLTITANGQGTPIQRRASYSARRRRSSTHRPIPPVAGSSSSSSLSSHGGLSPRKHTSNRPKSGSHRPQQLPRQRTLSMPTCAIGPEATRDLINITKIAKKVKSEQKKSVDSSCSYDTVIIGSPNVGKSTLAEYFNKGESSRGGGAGSSGSDQGIGSAEEDDDSYEDQDLLGGGKAILYRPQHHLELNLPHSTAPQFNFVLRIFCQQISAVNHLYKYDAVIILYSVTDRDSFEFARKALGEILPCNQARGEKKPPSLDSNSRKVVILVGNKSDLERSRCVTSLEGRSLATAYDVKFIEISSSLGVGITQLQKGLATQVLLRHGSIPTSGLPLYSNSTSSQGRNGSCSSSSTSSSNSSSKYLISSPGSKKGKGPLSSLKLAQKLIDRIMALRIVGGHKTKSCLDLHSL